MIILGVDPGFSVTGYAVMKHEAHTTKLLDYGYLQMSPRKSLSERVYIFYDFFIHKCATYQVSHLALETSFLGKNAQNFLKLGYLRGILYLVAAQQSLTLHEFSPTQIKQSVTGFGQASKEQVARVVTRLFPHMVFPEKADVTDAVAITLCGLWSYKQQQSQKIQIISCK